MGRDIPLGRIAGIKVGMHLSVILVGLLYVLIFATRQFPHDEPGLSEGAYWVAGVAGALLLFASLLVHELGHALVARDEGIGVQSMALTPLGGVTRMASSPTTAGAELRVSVVGPLASAACGVALLCVAYVLPDGGLVGLAGRVLGYLGALNLFLAAFNLLPATPLDGGKVLSALIWWRSGRQGLSMQIAAGVGVGSGAAGVLAAIWVVRNRPGNPWWPWMLIIGGFIFVSAVQELRSAPLYVALEGVRVAEAMTTGAPTAPAWSSVGAFVRSASPTPDQSAFPVVGADGRVAGLLTTNAIRAVPPERWDSLAVGDLAFPLDRLVTVTPDELLLPAVQKVDGAEVRSGLVIAADGTVIGTLDASALHRALTRRRAGLEIEREAAATVRP
ncbi:MAG: site-2 protease family protein [Acidimicrobiales bacterium]